jgi:formylglycine-generating enzyme required for sulfatase activity
MISFNSYSEVIEPDMVNIPEGTFIMGHDKWDSYINNKPAHLVSIKKFALAKYEVTNKEFQQYLTETKHTLFMETHQKDHSRVELTYEDNKPVFRKFSVDWKNLLEFEPAVCTAYIDWLTKSTNKPIVYRVKQIGNMQQEPAQQPNFLRKR